MIPGATLRRLRKAAGYDQAQMAAIVGVDRSMISLVERDKRNLIVEHLWRFVEACDARLLLVCPWDVPVDLLTEEERRCVEAWRGANRSRRMMMERFCSALSVLDDRDIAHLSGFLDVAVGARARHTAAG